MSNSAVYLRQSRYFKAKAPKNKIKATILANFRLPCNVRAFFYQLSTKSTWTNEIKLVQAKSGVTPDLVLFARWFYLIVAISCCIWIYKKNYFENISFAYPLSYHSLVVTNRNLCSL